MLGHRNFASSILALTPRDYAADSFVPTIGFLVQTVNLKGKVSRYKYFY